MRIGERLYIYTDEKRWVSWEFMSFWARYHMLKSNGGNDRYEKHGYAHSTLTMIIDCK